MDPLRNPFGYRPPPAAGNPPPGQRIPNGIPPRPPPSIPNGNLPPVDPITAMMTRAAQTLRPRHPLDPKMAKLQERAIKMVKDLPSTSYGHFFPGNGSPALTNFRPPQLRARRSREPMIYAGTYSFANNPAWGEPKEKKITVDREERATLPPATSHQRPATISLEESFHKEMIQLGLAGKQSIRDAIWSHRDLIVKFIGDVTDLREHANVDYEDRVGYINDYFTERIIRLHPLHELNSRVNTLSQAEANFLVENDYNIYRIVHRIFAPEMRFFDQFDYKDFVLIVEEETWNLRRRKFLEQMEGVLGSLGRLEITDGDAETGQEIQNAVIEHLAGEVEPARLQGIFEKDVLPAETIGAAIRILQEAPAEPEVERDDLENPRVSMSESERDELRELYIPEEELAVLYISIKGDENPGPSQPIPAEEKYLEPEITVIKEQEEPQEAVSLPKDQMEVDNYLPPEPIPEPILVDDASPPPEPAPEPLDEPYPPPEVSPESVLQDYEEVYDEEGALRDAEPITGSQAELQIVEQEYQGSETAERYEKPPYEEEYPTSPDSGYYGNDVPKVIISHPVAPPKSRFKIKNEKIQKGTHYSDVDVYSMGSGDRRMYARKYSMLTKKTVRFTGEFNVRIVCHNAPHRWIQECWSYVQKYQGTDELLDFPADYKFDPPEYWASHYKWTSGFESDYNTYRLFYPPGIRLSAHSTQADYTEDAMRNPGRRLILDSRLRKLPFRFDDPLMKTHVLPAHNGKREKVPATVLKEKMEFYLLDQYRKLIRYGNFWNPLQRTRCSDRENAYNHCYGPMIISDSLLEEADPSFLLNTGLFAFPPPIGVKEATELLEKIKAREYGVRDIVIIWGLGSLLKESAAKAVAEVLSLYRHLYNIMKLKVDIFKFQGFHRLEMPRFWLTTLPVSPTIATGMKTFNQAIKKIGELKEIPVIDWAGEFSAKKGAVHERNAEEQLEVLYDLLHEKVNVIPYRSCSQRQKDYDSGKEYSNSWEHSMEQKRLKEELERKKNEGMKKDPAPDRPKIKPRVRL